MSGNYQAGQYLLFHTNVQPSEIQQQEVLIATLKQLAEENKKLMKERELFEDERLQRKLEMKTMKHNFINLLTLAQYESNKWKFTEDATVRLSFNEKISKRSYINFQYLKDFNFFQKIRYSALIQMIKSNFRSQEPSTRKEAVFDCRPYNGPKTPPTPNSKYKILSSQNTDRLIKSTAHKDQSKVWSLEDMLFYLKRYKEDFIVYSGTNTRPPSLHEHIKTTTIPADNLFLKPKPLNSKVTCNDDSEFYKELIEKHKKSLEMIENVGNQLNQNIYPLMLTSLQMNQINELKLKSQQEAMMMDVDKIKNQIYTNYTEYLAGFPLVPINNICEEGFNILSNSATKNADEVTMVSNIQPDFIVSQGERLACRSVTPDSIKRDHNQSFDGDLPSDIPHKKATVTEPTNTFEEGEIIDSGDEVKVHERPKSSVKSNIKSKVERKTKAACKIDRSKLKSLDSSRTRRPLTYQRTSQYYSRFKTRLEYDRGREQPTTGTEKRLSSSYREPYRPTYPSRDDRRDKMSMMHYYDKYQDGPRYSWRGSRAHY